MQLCLLIYCQQQYRLQVAENQLGTFWNGRKTSGIGFTQQNQQNTLVASLHWYVGWLKGKWM